MEHTNERKQKRTYARGLVWPELIFYSFVRTSNLALRRVCWIGLSNHFSLLVVTRDSPFLSVLPSASNAFRVMDLNVIMSLPYTDRTSKSPLPIVRIPKHQKQPLCCFEALSCLLGINRNQRRPVPRDGKDG
jgi:hypothetical protein